MLFPAEDIKEMLLSSSLGVQQVPPAPLALSASQLAVDMPHTGSGRQPGPPSGHPGSKHAKLELHYRSSWSKPTVDILRRQGAINSLNPKIASYSRPATVLRFSCANPTGLQV